MASLPVWPSVPVGQDGPNCPTDLTGNSGQSILSSQSPPQGLLWRTRVPRRQLCDDSLPGEPVRPLAFLLGDLPVPLTHPERLHRPGEGLADRSVYILANGSSGEEIPENAP